MPSPACAHIRSCTQALDLSAWSGNEAGYKHMFACRLHITAMFACRLHRSLPCLHAEVKGYVIHCCSASGNDHDWSRLPLCGARLYSVLHNILTWSHGGVRDVLGVLWVALECNYRLIILHCYCHHCIGSYSCW